MITLRKSQERGHANHGWLDTYHSFSFADYYDPDHMGFSSLRVINDDRIAPGAGFPTHPHRDMEIITYILEGALEHKDSMGNGSVIRTGDVQRMSAGTGVSHSEFNHSGTEPVRLLQIWILPAQKSITPGYEQRFFAPEEKRGKLRLVASPDGKDGSITLHQDARLYASLLMAGDAVSYHSEPGRRSYLQVATGQLELNGLLLSEGDGAAISGEPEIRLSSATGAEILLFDLI
jgi:redox-sensitive bicupin YhaK (pirin superfamily)